MPATWGFESTLLLAFFYAFLYLTGLLVHAALVLVHEGVGLGEDGVDVGDGAFLDGAAEGDAEAACGVCLLKALQECIGFFLADVFRNQQEFVASHAEDVITVCGFGEDVGGALDEAVACFMAFCVILFLEAVDVTEDEGE